MKYQTTSGFLKIHFSTFISLLTVLIPVLSIAAAEPEAVISFLEQGLANAQSTATFSVPVADEKIVELAVTVLATSGGRSAQFGDVNGHGLRVWGGTEDIWWDAGGDEKLIFRFTPRDAEGRALSADITVQSLSYRHASTVTNATVTFAGGTGSEMLFAAAPSIVTTSLASPYTVSSWNPLELTRSGGDGIFQLRGMTVRLSDVGDGMTPEYGKAVVVKDEPWQTTHTLNAGVMEVSFGAHGGAYINHVEVPDIPDAMVRNVHGRYGRGWQGSVRDNLHGGRYNPTQAGWRDYAGTPALLRYDSDARLTVDRYNVPLYADPVFNFTRFNDLAEDFDYGDAPSTDTDGFDEPLSWTQDDEVRSEFDFEGFYENAGDPADNGCSVLRIFQRYSYARPPKAIHQFGPDAVRADGKAVYAPEQISIHGDLSTIFPGQQASEVDLAGITYTAFGIRLNPQVGLTNGFWRVGGEWQTGSVEPGGRRLATFKIPGSGINAPPQQTLDYGFLMVANGRDPDTAKGFALYVPMVERNAKTVVGIDKETQEVSYRENRFTDCYLFITSVITDQISIRSRFHLSGIFAPDHGDPKSMEALESEHYVLYGTPNQVLGAVQVMEAALHSGDGSYGTPESWLEAYQITDEKLDNDGDGHPAWKEYRAGTDPRRTESILRITDVTANPSIEQLQLRWQAVDGKSYNVFSTSDLTTDVWHPVRSNLPGTEPEASVTVEMDENDPVRFFRIEVTD